MPTSAIDLFSGAGGFSLGLQMAGIEVTHAVEIDKWAAETYAYNFPRVDLKVQDITELDAPQIRAWIPSAPDLIVGGPPCQGFSHSNTATRDPRDPRNSLFADFIRFAKVLTPKICILENVKGLLATANEFGERVIDIIRLAFEEIGYTCEYRVLNAADFGVPQQRERLFVVATRADLNVCFSWPDIRYYPPDRVESASSLFAEHSDSKVHRTLWEAISDLPPVLSGRSVEMRYCTQPQNEFQSLMREGRQSEIRNHEPMRHTQRIVARFSRIAYGQSEADVPELTLCPRRRGDPSRTSNSKYFQNSRRQRPDQPCNTIVASSHTNFVHPFLDRNFTVREILRAQSFPDWFVVKGKRAVLSRKLSERKGLTEDVFLDQRMQIGNAVPPLLGQEFGRAVLDAVNVEIDACA